MVQWKELTLAPRDGVFHCIFGSLIVFSAAQLIVNAVEHFVTRMKRSYLTLFLYNQIKSSLPLSRPAASTTSAAVQRSRTVNHRTFRDGCLLASLRSFIAPARL